MTERVEQRDERAALAPREAREMPYLRAIPRPTPWPIITAFGVTFMFAAIVTNIFVVVVGAVFALVGVIGWFREVFPHENVEAIPVADCEMPLPPPEFAPRPKKTPRNVVPERIHPYRSGVKGAIAGAIAMAVVAAAWGVIDAGSLWLPINLLAGTVLPSIGEATEAQLKAFNATWFATSIGLHAFLSLSVGMVFVVSLPMMPRRPLLAGGLIAPVIWTGIAWATLRVVNPTLEDYISWPWFLGSQVAFGLACGFVISRATMVPLQVGWSLERRMGVERTEDDES
ncbi:MAG: hypothetical protein GY728_11070 [Phycisphaeraceae bacterium]|nr:hypothetical protein [Phycisphaeraceae bacterium]MCP4069833.1 hypothetical protein [Phycisphaeraceae bacterium]MCP4497768.1 hypothetical protein [Phycisphaeraceae bacterium]MCP4797775.1 hypothetical protein [Phycisphaeraceae bacterium]MCP4938374.1 hypothetical protein [Phycisphaeraceae bacterium]